MPGALLDTGPMRPDTAALRQEGWAAALGRCPLAALLILGLGALLRRAGRFDRGEEEEQHRACTEERNLEASAESHRAAVHAGLPCAGSDQVTLRWCGLRGWAHVSAGPPPPRKGAL